MVVALLYNTHAAQSSSFIVPDIAERYDFLTVFEMLSSKEPTPLSSPACPQNTAKSISIAPVQPPSRYSYEQEEQLTSKQHSRASSSSSTASGTTNETYQTDFSDFQFDFGFETKPVKVNLEPAPILAQQTDDLEGLENESDMESLIDDNGSEGNEFDEDDMVLEEGEAVSVSIIRAISPTIIYIRRSVDI